MNVMIWSSDEESIYAETSASNQSELAESTRLAGQQPIKASTPEAIHSKSFSPGLGLALSKAYYSLNFLSISVFYLLQGAFSFVVPSVFYGASRELGTPSQRSIGISAIFVGTISALVVFNRAKNHDPTTHLILSISLFTAAKLSTLALAALSPDGVDIWLRLEVIMHMVWLAGLVKHFQERIR